jgi:hypothetical protein
VGFFLVPALVYLDEGELTIVQAIREIVPTNLAQAWWTIPMFAAAIVAVCLGTAAAKLRGGLAFAAIAALGAAVIGASLIGWQGDKWTDTTQWVTFTGFSANDYRYARFPAFPVMTIGAVIAIAAAAWGLARNRPAPS